MRKVLGFMLMVMISASFLGCVAMTKSMITPNQSAFTSEKIKPGMTKTEFVDKFGKPYKQAFYYQGPVLHETLYYKEISTWYVINTMFNFEDSILVSQVQGDEERGNSGNCCGSN